jgi:quinol monooxygenase YgiN
VVLARMSKWNFKKDKRKEAFIELDHLLNTLVHQTEGFRGSISLLSQDLNSATILTLWADIEALNKSEKEVFTQAIKKVEDFLESPPQIENFMVFRTELFQSSQWPSRWG